MASRPSSGRSTDASYQRASLRRAIGRHLPYRGVAASTSDRHRRWTDRFLVVCVILMGFSQGQTLGDRFADALVNLVAMHPGRRRPGKTYQGFMSALVKASDRLLMAVCRQLRQSVRSVAADAWAVGGWIVFGVDGTKINCPMTASNEKGLGCCSRKKSGPQMLLTMMFHVGSGVPWDFVRDVAKGSERAHLRQMIKTLPAGAMLLADAGFTGYDLLVALAAGGHSFVIRVGANVRLLTKLGYALERGDTVYLWPDARQKKKLEPMVLRLIKVVDDRNRVMHLLTNVTEAGLLSDRAAIELYKRRWLVEVLYRSLKQTQNRRKMLSGSPAHVLAELDWSVVSLWLLSLELAESTQRSAQASVAKALRAVRLAMAGRGTHLGAALEAAVGDRYQRHGSKKARHWPHKKRERPPGNPKARTATEAEVTLARELATERRVA